MLFEALPVDIIQYLIICPLVFLAGFVDSIAGGGGLISLPAYLIAGLPAHNALATNKMSSCMGTAMATFRFGCNGFIPWKIALTCIPCALIGGPLGALLALAIPERLFLIVMLVALPFIAFFVMRGRVFRNREPFSVRKTALIGMGSAFVIGIYDGVYGPGTGTFLILLLTSAAHMPLDEANGVTKTINLSTNVSALAVFLIFGKAYIILGLIAGLFSIAGNYLGAKLFTNTGAKSVRPIMLFVIAIFFVKVILELASV